MKVTQLLKIQTVTLCLALFVTKSYSQENSAGINVDEPNRNAVLHLASPDNDQGLLIPALTNAERGALGTSLASSADTNDGLIVFDEDDNAFYFWNGTSSAWTRVANTNEALLSNILSVNNNANAQIKNVVDPTDTQDAATKSYVDSRTLQDILGAGTDAGGNVISNLGVPINNSDAATKDYVDSQGDSDNQDLASVLGFGNSAGTTIENVLNPLNDQDAATKNYVDTRILPTDGSLVGNGTTAIPLGVNVGTGANQLVQLDGAGALPALDGSALTGVSSTIAANSITTTELAIGAVTNAELSTDAVSSANIADGSITDADIGNVDISKISGVGTAAVLDAGNGPNELVLLDGTGALPAVDGSALTGIAPTIAPNTITNTEMAIDAINSTNILDGTISDLDINDVDWTKVSGVPAGFADDTDDGITSLNLDAATTTGDGIATPLAVNTGTGANQIVQLDAGGGLPAVDGSALTGVTAAIGAGAIGNAQLAANSVLTGNIADGEITDADISGIANIAASKLEATVMTETENVSLLSNDAGYLVSESQDLTNVLSISNDAGGNAIANVLDPVNPQDVATMNYVDTQASQDLISVLGVGNDAAGGSIVNLADPINPQDVATMNYVDIQVHSDNQDLANVLGINNDAVGGSIINLADPINPQDVATMNYVDIQVHTDNQDLVNVLGISNDAAGGSIVNLADPINPQDVATMNYVDAQASQDLISVLGVGNDAAGGSIVNLADPINPQDVATMNYVDIQVHSDNQDLANVLGINNDAVGGSIINVADPINPQDVATMNYVDIQVHTDNQDLVNVLGISNDAAGGSIVNLADPINPQDVATMNYVDAQASQDLISVLGVGNDAAGGSIVNLADPINPQDVATMNYVDIQVHSDNQDLANVLGISNDAAGGSIVNLADPINPQDVATMNYVDIQVHTDNQDLVNVLGVSNDAAGGSIVNLADPINPQDVATMNYVDIQVHSDNQDLANVLGISNDAAGGSIANLADPINPQDVATMNYVDIQVHTDNQDLVNVLGISNDAAGGSIVNLADPINPQDVATMNYVDTNVTNSGNGTTIDASRNVNLGGTLTATAVLATGAGIDLQVVGGGDLDVDATSDFSAQATFSNIDVMGGSIAGTAISQTDNNLSLIDDGDGTRVAQFELSGIATATTRTFSLPDADGVLALQGDAPSFLMGVAEDANTVAFGSNSVIAASPGNSLQVIDDSGAGGATIAAATINPDLTGNRSSLAFVAARGITAAPADAVGIGDVLGEIAFLGHNGSGIVSGLNAGAEIRSNAAENWNGAANGTSLSFATTTSGTVGPSERLRIRNNGNVHVTGGDFVIEGDGANARSIIFTEGDANSGDVLGFKAPDDILNTPVIWELPDGDGSNGQALTTDGNGFLSWSNAGLVLPYSQAQIENAAPLLYVENSGTNEAARFTTSSVASTASALVAESVGASGSLALEVRQTGLGNAARFDIANAISTEGVMAAFTNGLGSVGYFENTNALNASSNFESRTNGTSGSVAIFGANTGDGVAAGFEIANASNADDAMFVTTNGTGSAANFNISNGGSAAPVVSIQTSGVGATLELNNYVEFSEGSFAAVSVADNTSGPGDDLFLQAGASTNAAGGSGGDLYLSGGLGDGAAGGGPGGNVLITGGDAGGGANPAGSIILTGGTNGSSDGVIASEGDFHVVGDGSAARTFILENGDGTAEVGFKADDTGTNTVVWELPDGDGIGGQVLITDGGGNLDWASPGLSLPYSDTDTGTGTSFDILNNGGGLAARFTGTSGAAIELGGSATFLSGNDGNLGVADNAVADGNALNLFAGSTTAGLSSGGWVNINAGTGNGGANGNVNLVAGFNGSDADGRILMQGVTRFSSQNTSQAGTIQLGNNIDQFAIEIAADPGMGADYGIVLPAAQGSGALTNDGAGNLAWGGVFVGPTFDDSNNVIFGSTAPAVPIAGPDFQLGVIASASGQATFTATSYDNRSQAVLFRANGTQGGGETALNADEVLGEYSFGGHDGSNYVLGAGIRAISTQAWASSINGTALSFEVTVDGTSNPGEMMRLENGRLSVVHPNGQAASDVQSFNAGIPSQLNLITANGIQSSPIALNDGEVLGELNFVGNFGGLNNFANGARIRSIAGENWGVGLTGAGLSFEVTLAGTGSPLEILRLQDDIMSLEGDFEFAEGIGRGISVRNNPAAAGDNLDIAAGNTTSGGANGGVLNLRGGNGAGIGNGGNIRLEPGTGAANGGIDMRGITRFGQAGGAAGTIELENNGGANAISISAHPASDAYAITLPQNQSTGAGVLINDGAGNLSWTAPASGAMTQDGNQNLIAGLSSGASLSGGANNVVMGTNADIADDSDGNIAIGNTALANDSSIPTGNSIAIGNSAQAFESNSIAIGAGAQVNDGALNSVAIGGGVTAVNPNTIILGDAASSRRVGIGTNVPAGRLDVFQDNPAQNTINAQHNAATGSGLVINMNGASSDAAIQITNSTQPIQIFDGAAAGRVLTSDATGVGTWQPIVADFIVDGDNNSIGGNGGIALAGGTGVSNIVIGTNTANALDDGSDNIAIGRNAAIPAGPTDQNIAIGFSATANQDQSIAIGPSASATGNRSVAIGRNAQATAANSIAIGDGTVAANVNTIVLGDADDALNVGIGSDSPGGKLGISQTTAADAVNVFHNNAVGDGVFIDMNNAGTGAALRVNNSNGPSIDVDGEVIVGGNLVTIPAAPTGGILTVTNRVMPINGNVTDINLGTDGQEVILIAAAGGLNVTNGAQVRLAGGADFTGMAVNSTLHLLFYNGAWNEVGRSVN